MNPRGAHTSHAIAIDSANDKEAGDTTSTTTNDKNEPPMNNIFKECSKKLEWSTGWASKWGQILVGGNAQWHKLC
jgi:hypothetical protein